ncbi:MAG: TetR/AcrR family transcriptional regulator [Chloroflexi bacterium]|nr:TetR/AcrR family transcriptional regulator [Chloroflexota bacterium]
MTASAPQKQVRTAARREQILQAAIACFSRKGYHLTTMDDIVTESGMSKGSLYWHYKNKKDILVAVMHWYFDQITEEMMIAIQQSQTAVEKLNILFDLFSDTIAAEDTLFSVFIDFYAETRHDEEITALLRQALIPYIDIIADIIREGVVSGEFKPVDHRYMAVVFMASTEGLLLYKIILAEEFGWRKMSQLYLETFLTGLLAETQSGDR